MTASIFHHLTVVFKASFCSLIKGITPNNLHVVFYPKSVLLNLSCVWISKAEVESKAQSSVVTKWIGGHYMLGFVPALRFLQSQILCRLYKSPLDETINQSPSCVYACQMIKLHAYAR